MEEEKQRVVVFSRKKAAEFTSGDLRGYGNKVDENFLFSVSLLFPNISNLNLSGLQNIDDSCMNIVYERFKCLIGLDVSECKITDKGLSIISNISSLQSLNLEGCDKITDVGAQNLGYLRYLETLNLRSHTFDSKVSEYSFLPKLRHLRDIDLGNCGGVKDATLGMLSRLSNLECLNLANCKKITDKGLELLQSLTELRFLNLAGCEKITNEGCASVGKMINLQTLVFTSSKLLSSDGVRHLRILSNLSELCLSFCPLIDDEALRLLEGHLKLRKLSLSYCPQITPKGAKKLVKALPQLETLEV